MEKFHSRIEPILRQEVDELAGFRREARWTVPPEAVREAVVNALIHRDWTRSTDIEVGVYANRMEVVSPGGLHNSMSIEKMKAGQRSPRNPMLVDVMRDFGYVDARGMGVRTRIIPLLRARNGRDPVFEATEDHLRTVMPMRKAVHGSDS